LDEVFVEPFSEDKFRRKEPNLGKDAKDFETKEFEEEDPSLSKKRFF
jgi:hypothetical protein